MERAPDLHLGQTIGHPRNYLTCGKTNSNADSVLRATKIVRQIKLLAGCISRLSARILSPSFATHYPSAHDHLLEPLNKAGSPKAPVLLTPEPTPWEQPSRVRQAPGLPKQNSCDNRRSVSRPGKTPPEHLKFAERRPPPPLRRIPQALQLFLR